MKYIITLIVLFLYLVPCQLYSANRYWVATTSSNWNNTANWSTTSAGAGGSSVPGSADVVIFDGGGVGDCAIDANASVTSISINAGYTGVVSQNTGITIATSSTFTVAAGTFTGGDSNIDVNSTFTISGGTFTSTSGTFNLSGALTNSGGTFNHNNGTIYFDITAARVLSITNSIKFQHVIINASATYALQIGNSANDTMIVFGNLTLTNGQLTYYASSCHTQVRANVTIQNTWDGGNCDLQFMGNTAIQDLDLTGATTLFSGNIIINKSAGKVRMLSDFTTANGEDITLTASELDLNGFALSCGGLFTQTGGVFTTGASNLDFNNTVAVSGGTFNCNTTTTYFAGALTHSGGTFNHNNGTVYFDITAARVLSITNSIKFQHVIINASATYALQIGNSANDTMIVFGNLTLTNGQLTNYASSCHTQVRANVTIQNTWDGGSCDLRFMGNTAIQDLDLTGATTLFSGNIIINKSAGKVRMLSDFTTANGEDITLTASELDLNGFALSCGGLFTQTGGVFTTGASNLDFNNTVTVSGGTFNCNTTTTYFSGTLTHSGGTFNHNNGTVYFDINANKVLTITNSINFNHVVINATATYYLQIGNSANDTMIVFGNLTLTNGQLTNYTSSCLVQTRSNVIIQSTWDGGNCELLFFGNTAIQDFDLTGATALHSAPVTINKSSGKVRLLSALTTGNTLTLTSGELDLNSFALTCNGAYSQGGGIFTSGSVALDFNSSFTLSGGTFNATSGTWNLNGAFTHTAGGTFTHNNGTIICDFSADRTWNFATSETFFNLTVNNTANTIDLFIAAGDNLIITNNLVLTNGLLSENDAAAKLTAQANVTVQSTWDGGTCDIEFSGGAAIQDFDLTGATTLHSAPITINKSSGKVRMLSALTTGNTLTLTAGELDLNSFALTCNAAYTQSGGIFTSGSVALDFNSSFTLSGGTFNATSGTWNIDGAFTHTAGGTFTHNNGTIICDFTADRTWNFATSETFFNLTVNNTANTVDLFISAGDNLIIANNLVLTNGLLSENDAAAKLTAQANVTVQSTWDAGTCDIEFSGGAAIQDFDLTGATALHSAPVTINKSSGKVRLLSALTTGNTLTLTSGELDLNSFALTCNGTYSQGGGIFTSGSVALDFNNSFTLSGGTFNATSGTWNIDGAFTHTAGGTFNHNNGTIICDFTADRTWNFATSETFYNFTINNVANTFDLFISAGDNLIIANNLVLTNGLLSENDAAAKLTAQANVAVQSTWDAGTCDIEFGGGAAIQDFDLTGATALHSAPITINKSSGKVRLLSALTTGNTLTLTSGELDLNSFALTCNGTYSQGGGIFTSGSVALDFNNSFTLSGGTFNASSGTLNIDGAFTHTAGGTFNHNNGTIYLDFTADKTWNFNNSDNFYNLTINTSAATTDLILAANDTMKVYGKIYLINGNYTLNAGSYVKMLGSIEIDGTWDGTATMPDLNYSGTDNIDIDLTGAEAKLTGNITINKSGGVVRLLSNMQLASAKTLTLTAGELNLNGKQLIITNSATNAIQRTNGYIKSESTNMSGKVQWFINTTTGAHIIPFGDAGGNYIPFTLNLTSGDCDTMKVATYYTASCATLPPTVTYLHPNAANAVVYRFWQIDKTGATGTFDITFSYANGEIPIDGENDLQAQRYTGTYWAGAIGGQTLNTGNNTVTVPGVTTFSPWALAKSSSPLPVELISFNAECEEKQVNIYWETASEINNDYFVIEKSINGIDYLECAKYDLAEYEANSNERRSYVAIDKNPYYGISYYRLKQVDLNGVFEIFDPISVNCLLVDDFKIHSVYSDVNSGSLKLLYNSFTNEEITIHLYNQSGQLMFERKNDSQTGMNEIDISTDNYNNGIYYIRLINSTQNISSKIYIQ